MSVDSVITQITGFKEDLTTDEFELIKTILDKVKYRQNDCDFEIIDDDFDDSDDKFKNNVELNEKFLSMFTYAQTELRKHLDKYLFNKNKEEFYNNFPIINYLFNGINPNRPFNEKIQINEYDKTVIVDDIAFLLNLTKNCQAKNKVIKVCLILAIYDHLIVNYKLCLDHLKFKQIVTNKIKELVESCDYEICKYTAYRLGNKHIFKIWYDQIVDQKN
jgi:hypothetical protein